MNEINIGNVIREARERLGMSQEELCGLAITPTTLSRIENGHILPSRKNREYICQKLGIMEYLIPYEPSKFDVEKWKIEKQIRKKISICKYDYSDLLEKYETMMDGDSALDRQFFMYAKAVNFDRGAENHLETKNMLLDALSQTFKGFSLEMDLARHYFSSLEITLMNSISLRVYREDKNAAMSLMRRLKEYCEKNISNNEDIIKNYISILFNVQNWEGFAENWEEAYKIADEGVVFCLENGNTFLLPDFFFDKGWNALQLDRKKEAKNCITEAYAELPELENPTYNDILKIKKDFPDLTDEEIMENMETIYNTYQDEVGVLSFDIIVNVIKFCIFDVAPPLW